MQLFGQLAWFFKAHWRTYSLALLMLATVTGMNMTIPYLIGLTVDQLVASPNGEADGRLLLLILALGLAVYGLRL
ncbi:MAG: hypothetical protein R3311_07450, partial [Oceanisphaera sp.]|nr:hypothetical protein [Oceanisphaera sp.]